MIYILISIKDRALEAFMPTGSVRAEGEALRVFKDLISDTNTPQGKHPDDYDLYVVGTFNDQNGKLEAEQPRKIADGKTLREMLNT